MSPSAAAIPVPNGTTNAEASGANGVDVLAAEDVTPTAAKSAASHLDPLYDIVEQPIGTRRHIRVACMGAGYSGLLMSIIFAEKMQNKNAEFVIYEKNEDLGGTWFLNRYPGCKCDIPAHSYAYSFAPNPDWPGYYATAPQIHAYMHGVADKYGVKKFMKFRHAIKSAVWSEDKGKWILQVQGSDGVVFQDEVDVFINAGGFVNKWKWPDIEGLHDFKGKLVHSARWDQDYEFAGKRVAVLGIGSSGIQIVPQLAKVCGQLDLHVRTKTWISPAPGINEPTAMDPEMDAEYNFSAATLETFKDPQVLRDYRAAIMDRRIDNFKRNIADTELQVKAQKMFRDSMRTRLGDTEKGRRVAEALLPDFPVGCRRQTPGPGFLEALTQDNVDLRWDDIARISEKGIVSRSSGEEIEYDAIVCATGFDTSYRPAFPVVGRSGVDLAEKWADDSVPAAYFGIAVPDMPNYFTFVGPNSCISNGSLVLAIQATGIYIYKWLEKLQTEMVRSFRVRDDAADEYNKHIHGFLQRTVWTRGCRSWYKRGTVDGPVVAVYGGTSFHFMEALKNPRWEDFHLERMPEAARNRFAFLGNGFSSREARMGSLGTTQTLNFDEYWNLFVLPDVHD